jgi:hypothetical protein
MSRSTLVVCVALSTLLCGCRQDTAPRIPAPAKLFVLNSACASGACTALRVLAFPANQPHTPGGYWSLDLGTVATGSACLTIPATADFNIVDVGTGATTELTWTTAEKLSIGSLTLGQSTLMASPSTNAFVPAEEEGWTVALPGNAAPTRATAPCQ